MTFLRNGIVTLGVHFCLYPAVGSALVNHTGHRHSLFTLQLGHALGKTWVFPPVSNPSRAWLQFTHTFGYSAVTYVRLIKTETVSHHYECNCGEIKLRKPVLSLLNVSAEP